MANMKWPPISNSLKKVYQEQNILHHFEKDESYLKNAFKTLDIFPFALNPNHTKIHYFKISKISKKLYHQLLKITDENYLIPKLKKCLKKSNEHTHYVYRYKRLFDKTENHF